MKSLIYKIFFLVIFNCTLFANELIKSQPEILFEFDKLEKSQQNLEVQVKFNKAVLLLGKQKYKEAIELLNQTSKYLEIPSKLNIAIGYYKLGAIDKAVIYLNSIYEDKKNRTNNTYSYMSSCYYLYEISKDNKYLNEIVNVAKQYQKLTEHSKRMLADTFILLKEYRSALRVLEKMQYAMELKKALIHMKLKNYEKAYVELQKALNQVVNPTRENEILWFMIFNDLKSNNIDRLRETMDLITQRKTLFEVNMRLPLEIFFNKNKYEPNQYLDFVTKLDKSREYNFLFYFAPFIFSDSQEIIYDSARGFIAKNDNSLENLENMVEFNSKFLDIIKLDPIVRVNKLKEIVKQNSDNKSYINYNLALSYAHIQDYHNAYVHLKKAFKQNPGNKLYASLMLVIAQKLDLTLNDKAYIENIINSQSGMYNYFGKKIYKLYINNEKEFDEKTLNYQNTVFYKALDYLEQLRKNSVNINHPLLVEHIKDPLIYLMKLIYRKPNKSDFEYYSRLQDTIPLRLNNNFLEGPLVITKYYIDILKALGLLQKADFDITSKKSPSYLRTKALIDLHYSNPDEAIKTIQYLQDEYELEDKYTMYLLVAAYLEAGRYNDASIQISLIKAILKDNNANFLTGVQLIQDLKFSSAKQLIVKPYKDALIDFKLVGFDDYLESL
ncbi:MAG: tetratricopeptide repeat protein [Campylobacterota bacterium]